MPEQEKEKKKKQVNAGKNKIKITQVIKDCKRAQRATRSPTRSGRGSNNKWYEELNRTDKPEHDNCVQETSNQCSEALLYL